MVGEVSAPAVAILSELAEAMVDAALERGGEGEVRALRAAVERYRDAGALGATTAWRRRRAPSDRDRRTVDVLVRLDRDLLARLTTSL
jgi:hypothetical protein